VNELATPQTLALYPGGVQTDERWDEDEPRRPVVEPDFAWGRTANPNTADGELQNIAAFSAGASRLTGIRRRVAVSIVWLILIGFLVGIVYGIVAIVV
jgi:hypothetical protein